MRRNVITPLALDHSAKFDTTALLISIKLLRFYSIIMIANPLIPRDLVGRRAELHQICHILKSDGDLLLAGVPGSGRRTLLRHAAQTVKARVIEIDCLRATDSSRFLQLLAEGIISEFQSPPELALIQRWSVTQPIILEQTSGGQARLIWHLTPKDEWALFQSLLSLPQALAEWLNCRVVLVFMNFPHIRSWDRTEKWQRYLRQEIQQQTRVSYTLISTFADSWVQHSNMQVIVLGPLKNEDLQPWIISALAAEGLQFAPETEALQLFLEYVQGHLGDAIALARRLWLDQKALLCAEAIGSRESSSQSHSPLPPHLPPSHPPQRTDSDRRPILNLRIAHFAVAAQPGACPGKSGPRSD